MTREQLNEIPRDHAGEFPPGVTEVAYPTLEQMDAFCTGLHYADDTDVDSGEAFFRDGQWVVRVGVGDWEDE